MRVAYLGNFDPRHSTETHIAASLESLGHEVVRIQEGATRALDVPAAAAGCDLLWWTQTYSLAEAGGTLEERHRMLADLREAGIPSVGFHLDRWWGLERQDQVEREAFFRVDHLFTADGDPTHEQAFADAGINHRWLPPAVYHAEAIDGRMRPQFRSDVAFVGSWRSYGHPSWEPYRMELFARLREWYGRRLKFWPQSRAIRGTLLNDLYASASVVVGDSCLAPSIAGTPIARYCSDRIPETTGRGGFLIHPDVEGITGSDGCFPHVPSWPLGDWGTLRDMIDHFLGDSADRALKRARMVAHTREHHTYQRRVEQALALIATAQVAT